MNLEQSPERGVRRIGAAVLLTPGPEVPDEAHERILIDVATVPLDPEGCDGLGRVGQKHRGILARCAGRSEPVPRDDAKVAAAPARVRPPEVPVRIVVFT